MDLRYTEITRIYVEASEDLDNSLVSQGHKLLTNGFPDMTLKLISSSQLHSES